MSTMEENKFEKQVRQKMDELKLNPSGSVWEHIKIRIEKRKSRRWELLIFFFLFALLLSGGYWLFNSPDSLTSNNKNISNNSKKLEGDSSLINKTVIDEKRNSKQLIQTEKGFSNSGTEKKNNAKEQVTKPGNQNIVKRKSNNRQKYGDIKIAVNTPEAETVNVPAKNNDEKKSNQLLNEPGNTVNIEIIPGAQNELTPIDSIKKEISTDKIAAKKLAAQEDTLASNNKKSFSPTPKPKWNVGFFIAGGISHAGNQFLGLGVDKSADYLQNSNGSIPGGPSGGNQTAIPSKVKNAGGFLGGVFLEKSISAKTKFSFGINYKEFNLSGIVGQKNDTTGNYSVRSAGDKYINNFKFIELPLQLKVQLGKGKTFPVFWSGGITLSQLVSSNALQFNPGAGIYFIDNSLFNKTQIGLNTGVSTALFQNQKSSILLGPHFFYAASQLAGYGLYNKKHFAFIGLRTEIIFKKK